MHLDHDQPYIFTVKDILSADECEKMIERIKLANPELATINSRDGVRVKLDVRNNERVIFDDMELATTLMDKIKGHVPGKINKTSKINKMNLVGVNERFRCYRYKKGMKFAPHADGVFYRDENEQSFYTFMVYLNEGFEGGNTTFLVEPEVSIKPQTGTALFFQHPIIHEGSVVTSGIKYVLRTDLMYQREIPV